MDKYLLNTEKKEIDNITEMLSNSLDNKDIEDVKVKFNNIIKETKDCLLYTSDAADEEDSVKL